MDLGVACGPRFPLYLLLVASQKDAAAIANAAVSYPKINPKIHFNIPVRIITFDA